MRISIKIRRAAIMAGAALVMLASSVLIAPAASAANPLGAPPPVSGSTQSGDPTHPLVLAHFYIWFNHASWKRAKVDYPLAGRYSSSDSAVMKKQVEQAKSAGIDGFIVSWKSTPLLDERLRTLVSIAEKENFKLELTYQGLTFDRVNVPISRVGTDLDLFTREFASSPVFDLFGKPVVVLTGTPGWTAAEIRSLTAPRRAKLTMLASEKNLAGYERVAPYVDGDLYYWSSVNPETFGDYAGKLRSLGAAVRDHGGLWIAPAAPGFDARHVGGKSNVSRAGGATLRTEWNAALSSLPAAIGIISWNEFSENSYVEPSERYGAAYVDEIRQLTGTRTPAVNVDSSGPAGAVSPWRPTLIFSGVAVLLGCCSIVALRRRRAFR